MPGSPDEPGFFFCWRCFLVFFFFLFCSSRSSRRHLQHRGCTARVARGRHWFAWLPGSWPGARVRGAVAARNRACFWRRFWRRSVRGCCVACAWPGAGRPAVCARRWAGGRSDAQRSACGVRLFRCSFSRRAQHWHGWRGCPGPACWRACLCRGVSPAPPRPPASAAASFLAAAFPDPGHRLPAGASFFVFFALCSKRVVFVCCTWQAKGITQAIWDKAR